MGIYQFVMVFVRSIELDSSMYVSVWNRHTEKNELVRLQNRTYFLSIDTSNQKKNLLRFNKNFIIQDDWNFVVCLNGTSQWDRTLVSKLGFFSQCTKFFILFPMKMFLSPYHCCMALTLGCIIVYNMMFLLNVLLLLLRRIVSVIFFFAVPCMAQT